MAAFPPGVSLGDGAPHSIMAPETLPLKSEKRDKEQQFKQNLLLQHNPPTCEPVDESNRRPSCISASAAITPPPVGETTPARAAGAVETPGAAAATETEGCLLQWFPGFDLPIGLKGRAILRRVLNQRRSLDAARCVRLPALALAGSFATACLLVLLLQVLLQLVALLLLLMLMLLLLLPLLTCLRGAEAYLLLCSFILFW